MQEFNVIIYDFNKKEFIPYNIIPYLLECYYKEETPPQSLEEFKIFIKRVSSNQWWSRCEYEILLSDWPNQSITKKVDVYYQVFLNIDIISAVLMNMISIK